MNLIRRTRKHILINQEEVGIFACADTTSFILDEHLLGNVDGQGCNGLFASNELLGPPRRAVLS